MSNDIYIHNTINAVFFSIYGMVLYINDVQYTGKTLTVEKMYTCVGERAERASLENFGIFTFLNCHFFQYFVGTSHTLSVQMTCLSAYMYRQKSEKALLGGGGGGNCPLCPPPPPLATLVGLPRSEQRDVLKRHLLAFLFSLLSCFFCLDSFSDMD